MSEKLDEKDFAIIEELRKNSHLSEQKIAKKTGIPMTTVHNRVGKLREAGVIEAYTIRLNYAKIGRPVTAYVQLKCIQGADQRDLLLQISKIPHVQEAAMVTGEFDLMFKARVESMEELNKIVVQGLRKQKNVGETRTMISYETIEKL